MFAEKLITPHSSIAREGIIPEPLLDSVRFRTIRAAYEASDHTYEDMLEATYATAGLVRQTLRFEPHKPDHPEFSAENLTKTQQTNCHGHSIVTSECLDELGIPHLVGFANQHSFLLVQSDDEDQRINLVDTAVKQLYIDITPAVVGPRFDVTDEGNGQVRYLRGDVILDRSQFLKKEKALQDRPWMSFMVGREAQFRFAPADVQARANTLILRSYQPAQGRHLLHAYANFTHSVANKSFIRAHEWLQPLDGLYPDIDSRNRLHGPTRVVRGLAVQAKIQEALDDIGIIERSLSSTQDLLLRLWPVDHRRKVAVVGKDNALLEESIEAYDRIWQDRREQGLSVAAVEARIRKARSQRLATTALGMYPTNNRERGV